MSVCCILVYRGLARDRRPRSAVRRHPGCMHGVLFRNKGAVVARLGNSFPVQIRGVLWSSIRFLLELVPRHSQRAELANCCATQSIAALGIVHALTLHDKHYCCEGQSLQSTRTLATKNLAASSHKTLLRAHAQHNKQQDPQQKLLKRIRHGRKQLH